jgi:hypothetical protein
MNKKEIILFGVGFLVGYIVIRAKKNNIIVAPKSQNLPNVSSQTEPPKVLGGEDTELVETKKTEENIDPRIENCKEKWLKFSSTVKFSSQEQMQSTYNNYMTTCVAQS